LGFDLFEVTDQSFLWNVSHFSTFEKWAILNGFDVETTLNFEPIRMAFMTGYRNPTPKVLKVISPVRSSG